MNRCLQEADVPERKTKRKTTLIQKDPLKGTISNNYRPITCIAMMWKILTSQISEEIYDSLTSHRLVPKEQKGCHNGSRATGELLYIDQHIVNERKTKRKNLSLFVVNPQSLIINCLKMYKISDEVINFIKKTMKTWRVKLTAGRKSLAKANTRWDIFLEMRYHHYYL